MFVNLHAEAALRRQQELRREADQARLARSIRRQSPSQGPGTRRILGLRLSLA